MILSKYFPFCYLEQPVNIQIDIRSLKFTKNIPNITATFKKESNLQNLGWRAGYFPLMVYLLKDLEMFLCDTTIETQYIDIRYKLLKKH